jgi:hypothetical protein
MTRDSAAYIPFSQRVGLEPIPPQLKIGDASEELRRILCYYIFLEIDRVSTLSFSGFYGYVGSWKRVAQDLHVLFFKKAAGEFSSNALDLKDQLKKFIATSNIGRLFDFVEFLLRHEKCSSELKLEIASAFVTARAAYRVFDIQCIAAIGSEEQAAAFEQAIAEAELKNATAARMQLIKAGVALRNGEWADSVRESIHAVEAMAIRIAPGNKSIRNKGPSTWCA